MMKRIITVAAALSITACATVRPDVNIDELSNARAAIAAAKAAGAEQCAPKLQAQAVANLYWAGHEFTEHGIHPDENAELAASAESKAKAARAIAVKGCKPEIIKLDGIRFPHDSARITPAAAAILDKAVNTLKRRSDIKVEVAAHTDSSASDAYNLALSNRRAASVMSYLESHGISASRLTSKGYGESQPIASNATKEGRTQNRRVELRVQN
jgi:outer membrane protein OmpA-like peptidoglycan-associated protein